MVFPQIYSFPPEHKKLSGIFGKEHGEHSDTKIMKNDAKHPEIPWLIIIVHIKKMLVSSPRQTQASRLSSDLIAASWWLASWVFASRLTKPLSWSESWKFPSVTPKLKCKVVPVVPQLHPFHSEVWVTIRWPRTNDTNECHRFSQGKSTH